MKLGFASGVLLVLLLLAILLGYGTLFTVYQTQQALVIRLGNPVATYSDPGLHFKVPVIDTVVLIDRRILDLENSAQEVIALDQKRLVVDAFARYKIVDPLQFYQSVRTIEAANGQLSTMLNSALRNVLGEVTLQHVVRDQREELMARTREQLDSDAKAYGISVVDVRIRRADLPPSNSQAVYGRMQSERQAEAAQLRASGLQKAQEIRARADRDVTVLIADATSKAEQIRGEGDAQRTRIFAEAYGRDPDFFAFYRTMQAYEAGLLASDTRYLLKPDSYFFRYFTNPLGASLEAAQGSKPAQTPAATPGPAPASPPAPASTPAPAPTPAPTPAPAR
jgi:membrane protease subunit HflC